MHTIVLEYAYLLVFHIMHTTTLEYYSYQQPVQCSYWSTVCIICKIITTLQQYQYSSLLARVVLLYLLASRTSRSVHSYSSMIIILSIMHINLIFRVVVCVLASTIVVLLARVLATLEQWYAYYELILIQQYYYYSRSQQILWIVDYAYFRVSIIICILLELQSMVSTYIIILLLLEYAYQNSSINTLSIVRWYTRNILSLFLYQLESSKCQRHLPPPLLGHLTTEETQRIKPTNKVSTKGSDAWRPFFLAFSV